MFQFIFALFYWIRDLMEQQRHPLNCSHPPSWWWWLSIQETLKFDLIQWLSLSLSVLTSKHRRVNSKSALEKMIQLSCLSESPTAQSSCAQPISLPYITFVTSCQAVYFSKTFRISTAMLWQFVEIKYVKIKIKWIKKMLCMTLFSPSISHRRYESALDRRHSKRKWVEKKVFSLIWIVFGARQCVPWRRRCGRKVAATTWLLCNVLISLTLTWVQGSCGWLHRFTAKLMTITLSVILNWVNVELKQSTQ